MGARAGQLQSDMYAAARIVLCVPTSSVKRVFPQGIDRDFGNNSQALGAMRDGRMRNLGAGNVSIAMDDVSDEDVASRGETGAGSRSNTRARQAPAELELEPELQALVNTLRRVPPLPTAVRARALARARAVLDETKTRTKPATKTETRKPGRAPRDVSNIPRANAASSATTKFPARRLLITKMP